MITFGIIGSRILILRCFYDTMLVSILTGWAMNKPQVLLNEKTNNYQWKETEKQVKEWIEFYHVVVVRIL
jgi:hypothetical protein